VTGRTVTGASATDPWDDVEKPPPTFWRSWGRGGEQPGVCGEATGSGTRQQRDLRYYPPLFAVCSWASHFTSLGHHHSLVNWISSMWYCHFHMDYTLRLNAVFTRPLKSHATWQGPSPPGLYCETGRDRKPEVGEDHVVPSLAGPRLQTSSSISRRKGLRARQARHLSSPSFRRSAHREPASRNKGTWSSTP
jgi:hypothetical protein